MSTLRLRLGNSHTYPFLCFLKCEGRQWGLPSRGFDQTSPNPLSNCPGEARAKTEKKAQFVSVRRARPQ